jgi:hypothetical protein
VRWPMLRPNAFGSGNSLVNCTAPSTARQWPSTTMSPPCFPTQCIIGGQSTSRLTFILFVNGELRVHHMLTAQQFADVMTKGLPSSTFMSLRSSLCIAGVLTHPYFPAATHSAQRPRRLHAISCAQPMLQLALSRPMAPIM